MQRSQSQREFDAASVAESRSPKSQEPARPSAMGSAAASSGGAVSGTARAVQPAEVARDDLLASGTIIAGRYRVDQLLGEGGMGAVYRGEHVAIHRPVAIKVLHPEMSRQPEMVARFEREAIVAGSLSHPNVASAFDFGQLTDGSFFLVLEFVDGRTLRTEIQAGPMAPYRALKIVQGIVAGVGAAHAKGIIHRDLKPENIMLVEREDDPDFVRVLDFGIAKFDMNEGERARPITVHGLVFGTPDYMAPEQALGGPTDARSDLYAIGVILYELMAGRCPFQGGAMTLMSQRIVLDAPPLPPEVADHIDPRITQLISRLMQRQPEARLQNADELTAALREILKPTSAPTIAAPVPLGPPSQNGLATESPPVLMPVSRRRLALGGLALAMTAAAIGIGAFRAGSQSASATLTDGGAPTAAAASVSASQGPPAPSAVARGVSSAAVRPARRPAASASASIPPAGVLPDPTVASESSAPPVASATTSASGSAATPGKPSRKRPRRTVGGIYIPPPSQWFR